MQTVWEWLSWSNTGLASLEILFQISRTIQKKATVSEYVSVSQQTEDLVPMKEARSQWVSVSQQREDGNRQTSGLVVQPEQFNKLEYEHEIVPKYKMKNIHMRYWSLTSVLYTFLYTYVQTDIYMYVYKLYIHIQNVIYYHFLIIQHISLLKYFPVIKSIGCFFLLLLIISSLWLLLFLSFISFKVSSNLQNNQLHDAVVMHICHYFLCSNWSPFVKHP